MGEGKKSQWHPAFYGALHLELAENKRDLEFTEEFILNTLPLRVDTLIIKKKAGSEIYNEIGKIFKRYNLVEYKSPKDSFKPEIDAAFNSGFDDGFSNGIDDKGMKVFKNMIQRGFSREEAQSLAEISDELVERALLQG